MRDPYRVINVFVDHPGGCYTCRYSGPQPMQFTPLMHEWVPCSRPNTWPATFPHKGCAGWEREPGSDDEIHLNRWYFGLG